MGFKNGHRHGSMAIRPRKRARSQVVHIGSWAESDESVLLGFAGYKAGMTHVTMVDDRGGSPSKGSEIMVPVTVVETPPMLVYGVRAYKKTPYGKKTFADVVFDKVDEKTRSRMRLAKKCKNDLKKLTDDADSVSDVSVLVLTKPEKTGFAKKNPELMEIGVGGKDSKSKLEFASGLLGKEVSVKDVLHDGEFVDTFSVTIGKGWQGAVKRFGVHLQRRKSTGRRRHVGTLGPWHPARVMYTVPMAGQTGYHNRMEHNKRVLKVAEAKDDVNPNGGFPHYGLVKNDYLLVKGSVGGPKKRLIRFRKAVRQRLPEAKPEIKYISKESKQGA